MHTGGVHDCAHPNTLRELTINQIPIQGHHERELIIFNECMVWACEFLIFLCMRYPPACLNTLAPIPMAEQILKADQARTQATRLDRWAPNLASRVTHAHARLYTHTHTHTHTHTNTHTFEPLYGTQATCRVRVCVCMYVCQEAAAGKDLPLLITGTARAAYLRPGFGDSSIQSGS